MVSVWWYGGWLVSTDDGRRLEDNFEECADGSLPRGTMYRLYETFCSAQGLTPCNSANFGKNIRALYPDLKVGAPLGAFSIA